MFYLEFFKGIVQRHPIVPTSSTPIYSNAAFQILGYLLEEMTGHNFQEVLAYDLLEPLGLFRTFYNTPDSSLGIIPNTDGLKYWNFPMGDETP